MDILAAMQQRTSVRSYADRSVNPALLDQLLALSTTAEHLAEVPPRVALVNGEEWTQRVLTYMVGSYGLVQTPPHLLVGVLPDENDLARLDLGYVLEQIVLDAARLELGTCWITGSYDAEQAGDAVGLASGEVAAAVCALGYPTERGWGRIHTRVIRRLAGGHQRKPLTEIVFAGRWGESWSADETDPTLVAALEHARLAPSATNRQPWRFIVRQDDVALALVRPKPIDAGIVMAHFALASAALGRVGRWQVRFGDTALAQECALPHDVIPVATFF